MANLDLLNEFWKRTEQDSKFRGYASTIRKARPFTLDAELAEIVGQICRHSSGEMRQVLNSFRLPYPVMWLEASFDVALKFIGRRGFDWKLSAGPPDRVGWLITEAPEGSGNYAVTRIATVEVEGQHKAHLYPVTHLFSAEHTLSVENAFRSLAGKVHPEVLEAVRSANSKPLLHLAWGSQIPPKEERDWNENPLLNANVMLLEPLMIQECVNPTTRDDSRSIKERAQRIMEAGAQDQAGDLGFIVVALSLLNEVPVRYVPFKPSGMIRANGSLRPYMTSSIVSIEVPATRRRIKDIEKMLRHKGLGAKKARHEVRGHWRHADKLPLTEESHGRWERFTDREGRLRWRTWIAHHERGDASIGFVRQTYHATKGRGSIPGMKGEEHGAS